MNKLALLHKADSRRRPMEALRYPRAMKESVDGWIKGTSRPPGRQACFAVARGIDDPREPDSFHAFVSGRQEMAKAAPLKRTDSGHCETGRPTGRRTEALNGGRRK